MKIDFGVTALEPVAVTTIPAVGALSGLKLL